MAYFRLGLFLFYFRDSGKILFQIWEPRNIGGTRRALARLSLNAPVFRGRERARGHTVGDPCYKSVLSFMCMRLS
jgi:hypothetical protein